MCWRLVGSIIFSLYVISDSLNFSFYICSLERDKLVWKCRELNDADAMFFLSFSFIIHSQYLSHVIQPYILNQLNKIEL
jgi:hypothetical protein